MVDLPVEHNSGYFGDTASFLRLGPVGSDYSYVLFCSVLHVIRPQGMRLESVGDFVRGCICVGFIRSFVRS